MAGAWSSMERKREEVVWSELDVRGGVVPGVGLEVSPWGHREVSSKHCMKRQPLAASPASCGLHSGWISGTSDTSNNQG